MEASKPTKIEDSECGTLAYIAISLTLLSMTIVILLHYRKSKFCRELPTLVTVKIQDKIRVKRMMSREM